VAATEGELLWFRGKPAFTAYARDCGGHTEDASAIWPDQDAPYLLSHIDTYCTRAGASTWQWSGSLRAISDALHESGLHCPARIERITVVDRTSSGRARTLMLSGAGEFSRINEGSFRFAIGRDLGWNTVRSDRYDVRVADGRVLFDGAGSGHGVGLCQRGADEMGREGRSYREILAYYYPGTILGFTGAGLSWQHLSGERIALWTVQPAEDRVVLASAERSLRKLELRTGWRLPNDIQLRVYPDVDTFRNATGESGSVAAYTQGHRIYLQPVRQLQSHEALESTLKHELAHVGMASQARGGLPLWFREGLANDLAGVRHPAGAYSEATATVVSLINRYGEATVLSWVAVGLPPDVRNASKSQPATKSR
jgi:stage II sporulation protein D